MNWHEHEYATNADAEESHVNGLLQAAFEVRELVDFHILSKNGLMNPSKSVWCVPGFCLCVAHRF